MIGIYLVHGWMHLFMVQVDYRLVHLMHLFIGWCRLMTCFGTGWCMVDALVYGTGWCMVDALVYGTD
jgi:hypothetical protein